MRRAAIPAAVALALAGCTSPQPTLDLTVTGDGPATLVWTAGPDHGTETIALPYERRWRAVFVVAQVTVGSGRVGCTLRYDGAQVTSDADERPTVAACSASLLERG